MKKLIPLLILLGGAASGFSQGQVNFENSAVFLTPDSGGQPAGTGGRLVYDMGSPLNTATGVGLVGTTWVAELYSGLTSGSLTPITASISRFRASTTVNKGKWAASGINGPNNPTTIPNCGFSTDCILQVKVWDITTSATYEGATGKTGSSAEFNFTTPPSGDLTPSDFFMNNFSAFALVPEPSAIALGIMGVAGLLLIRRRK